MSLIQWFNTQDAVADVVLLPRGPRSEYAGGSTVVLTQRALWFQSAHGFGRISFPAGGQLQPINDGLLATHDNGRQIWLGHGTHRVVDAPGTRAGQHTAVCRSAGGPWTQADATLPGGARWSSTTRPWPIGAGIAWSADGFVYRRGTDTQVVSRDDTFAVGPLGAVLLGSPFLRIAPPGRPVLPLEAALVGPLIWSADGHTVTGTSTDGLPLRAYVHTGEIESLHTPQPTQLRAFTFGTSGGLATGDHDGELQLLDREGVPQDRLRLPLSDGVALTEARVGGVLDSAGQYWTIKDGQPVLSAALPSAKRIRVAGQRLIGTHTIGDTPLGWASSGLLLRWP